MQGVPNSTAGFSLQESDLLIPGSLAYVENIMNPGERTRPYRALMKVIILGLAPVPGSRLAHVTEAIE
jgi:hypothetical protein